MANQLPSNEWTDWKRQFEVEEKNYDGWEQMHFDAYIQKRAYIAPSHPFYSRWKESHIHCWHSEGRNFNDFKSSNEYDSDFDNKV